MTFRADLAVLFEHPEWHKPLFQALDLRGARYLPVDLKNVRNLFIAFSAVSALGPRMNGPQL